MRRIVATLVRIRRSTRDFYFVSGVTPEVVVDLRAEQRREQSLFNELGGQESPSHTLDPHLATPSMVRFNPTRRGDPA